MSFSYVTAERICYFLNRFPKVSVKNFMLAGADKLSDNETLPKIVIKRCRTVKFIIDGFSIYKLSSKHKGYSSDRAVLFLPGGGGMARATWLHYDTASKIAEKSLADVYIANYPLAPKYNVRYALKWLEKIYKHLLQKYSSENITFIGDSAGANLILSLTYRSRIKPAKLFVISPACGLQNGCERNIRLAMEPFDPILSVKMNDIIADNWCRDVPMNSPDISPEYIDYSEFPKIYLFCGSHELFYPHVLNYIDILKKSNVSMKVYVKPMCHDWALCRFFPEGRKAVNIMSSFV